MLNFRRILAFIIIVSVVIVTTVIYRNMQQLAPEEILNLLPDDVELALQDLHYTQNENGQRSWTLDADKAEYIRDRNLAKLDTVKLQLFKTEKFDAVVLQADKGQLEQDTRQVDLWDNVVITATNGEQLFTDRLHYDDNIRQISSEKNVLIRSPRFELTGVGMVVEIDKGRLLLKKQVRLVLYPSGRENQ